MSRDQSRSFKNNRPKTTTSAANPPTNNEYNNIKMSKIATYFNNGDNFDPSKSKHLISDLRKLNSSLLK